GGLIGAVAMLSALGAAIWLGGPNAPWVLPWWLALIVLVLCLAVLWGGGGAWSIDRALTAPSAAALGRAHPLGIIGGGRGRGAQPAARVRARRSDRRNHHLFQPLLYQVATGELSPANIASPLRGVLGTQRNAEVLLGEAVGFHPDQRRVVLADGEVHYDTL